MKIRGKISYQGYRFNNEMEYRKYLGIMELIKVGRLKDLEVHPTFDLVVNDRFICKYTATFQFYDPVKEHTRIVHVGLPSNEIKVKLFEAINGIEVENW
jgi:hypothetical protein